VNSWQGLIKKEQEPIFEKLIGLPHNLIISFIDEMWGMRLFFLTIPKPLKQHPL